MKSERLRNLVIVLPAMGSMSLRGRLALSFVWAILGIASPLLAMMKEREEKYVAIRTRLASKGLRDQMSPQEAARMSLAAPAARTGGGATTAAPSSSAGAPTAAQSASVPQQSAPAITPRARKQKRR